MDKKNKSIIILAVVAVVVIALVVGAIFIVKGKDNGDETTEPQTTAQTVATTEPVVEVKNPLTGETDFDENAVNKRVVGFVVENSPAARPQWGMDDANYAPDIIIEGEVEGGISRMLWLYADTNALPSQIGPMRSARPPFIKFSELFDAIFIHWGMSQSKGDYTGADTVFSQDGVDHINQMSFSDSAHMFGRDSSTKSGEHTGVVYGDNVTAGIESAGFRTEANTSDWCALSFNDSAKPVGGTACDSITVQFSSRTETRTWNYSSDDGLYYSTNYQNNVARENIIVLYDQTNYVVKSDYKDGKDEVYCNYALAGGSGKLASNGTITDITWSTTGGKLNIMDANGNPINLNPGKSWIGWTSSNNGGSANYH